MHTRVIVLRIESGEPPVSVSVCSIEVEHRHGTDFATLPVAQLNPEQRRRIMQDAGDALLRKANHAQRQYFLSDVEVLVAQARRVRAILDNEEPLDDDDNI